MLIKKQIYLELGIALIEISKKIPNGILIFFSSTFLLEKCLNFWASSESNNILRLLQENKRIITETKIHKNKAEKMHLFEKYANKEGAILFAVCRGVFSEGYDFNNTLTKAVIMIGVPFPNKSDDKIKLKIEYLDNCIENGSNCLTSREWYNLQALRATNQSIGRIIRNPEDWGSIILFDERFAKYESNNNISKWIKDHLIIYDYFTNGIIEMNFFIENKIKIDKRVQNNEDFSDFEKNEVKEKEEKDKKKDDFKNEVFYEDKCLKEVIKKIKGLSDVKKKFVEIKVEFNGFFKNEDFKIN